MSQQPALGARLKALRTARGLRQGDLAGGKVTVAYISMVESGKRTPGLEVLTHLADRLGCTVGELQGGPSADEEAARRLRVGYAELALHNGAPGEALAEAQAVLAAITGPDMNPDDRELAWRARWIRGRAWESMGELAHAANELADLYGQASTANSAFVPIDPTRVMQVALTWARCLTQLGDVAGADEVVVTALQSAGQLGLEASDAFAELTSTHMSLLYMLNDIDGAAAVAEQLIEMVEAGGTRRARAAAYWNAAGVAEAQRDLANAVVLSQRAVALLAEEDDERMLARARTACAWFMLRADPQRAAEALEMLVKAREVFEITGSETDLAYTRVEAGQALILLERPEEALVEAALAVDAIGDQIVAESASAWLVQATAQAATADLESARVSAARAESCLRELPATRWTALGFRELGQVHELLGDTTLALAAYREALDLSAHTGSPAGTATNDARSTRRVRR